MAAADTMDAVIFKAPFQMATEKRPIPKIIDPTDAIIKVTVAGICGSDLHFYRGHQKMEPGCICVSHVVQPWFLGVASLLLSPHEAMVRAEWK